MLLEQVLVAERERDEYYDEASRARGEMQRTSQDPCHSFVVALRRAAIMFLVERSCLPSMNGIGSARTKATRLHYVQGMQRRLVI